MHEIDREWVLDMLEYAKKAVRIAGSRDANQLVADEAAFLAATYAIQTIGEAANRISPAGRALLSEVPWSEVIGMRHRLVHGYRARSAIVIVGTVRDSLPSLIAILERGLGEGSQ
jgi:uncharacterized protein with HEPN domain